MQGTGSVVIVTGGCVGDGSKRFGEVGAKPGTEGGEENSIAVWDDGVGS